ncbi:MAG TPA: cytochrome c-type biogenesis protein CcmH [Polyangiaceae bacterium]|nr:cytochrome c-type biogenesis protein CcmH [Polyangiaceae bacterium]
MKAAPSPRQKATTRAAVRAALMLLATSVFVAFGLATSTARAEDPVTAEQRAQSLTRSVMSPFCPGRTLDTCPSPRATEWRAQIRQWVSEGLSNDEIRRRLQQQAPDPKEDLTGGPSTGVGMWFPVAAGLGFLGLLAYVLKRLSAARASTGSASSTKSVAVENKAPPVDDAALEARLDEEIRQSD